MKPYSNGCLLTSTEKYLFTILLLATVSMMGYSIEKAYSQLEDSQVDEPSTDSKKDDASKSSSKDKSTSKMFVKITSHKNADVVDAGELDIYGISSDSGSRDCIVEVDWNNDKPAQIVTPTGPGGSSDFSTWTYTYTKDYHEIEEGPNELTSKLTCINPGPVTKWFSVTLTGVPPPFPRPLPVP
jgi:hypothetical protein